MVDPLQNSWSCPQAYRDSNHLPKSLLDGAVDFLSKISHQIWMVSFVRAFISVWTGSMQTSINTSKWGLNKTSHMSEVCPPLQELKWGIVSLESVPKSWDYQWLPIRIKCGKFIHRNIFSLSCWYQLSQSKSNYRGLLNRSNMIRHSQIFDII